MLFFSFFFSFLGKKYGTLCGVSFLNLDLVIFRAYDRAAIKFRGVDADLNFGVTDYEEDMKQVINMHHN